MNDRVVRSEVDLDFGLDGDVTHDLLAEVGEAVLAVVAEAERIPSETGHLTAAHIFQICARGWVESAGFL